MDSCRNGYSVCTIGTARIKNGIEFHRRRLLAYFAHLRLVRQRIAYANRYRRHRAIM